MTPSVRKLALTVHVIASVGWIGALAVFLAHAIVSVASEEALIVRAACIAMGLTAWFVIFPLSITALVTGLVQALGTAWGLLRHYWIVAKLLLTVLATAILLLKLAPIGYLANAAEQATFSRADLAGLQLSLLIHAVGGLLVLLTVATLAIYKPVGVTPFGLRKRRDQTSASPDFETATGTPRWVKGFALVLGALILLIGIMMLAGTHGPGAHVG